MNEAAGEPRSEVPVPHPRTLVPGPDRAGVRRRLARLVARAADGIIRLLGASPAAGREAITEDELRDLVAANTVLRYEERALIGDVLAAAQRQVREVIVPRTEVVFLDAGTTVSRALRQVSGQMHSRYPVIDGSSDEVTGVVRMRDLVAPPVRDHTVTVADLATEIERIPSSKPLIAALAEMRRDGRRIALVVDEYGGTAGIVTLEDLVEGLVGELRPGAARGPVSSAVDGRTNLASLAERTGLSLSDGPYETVGGYLMAALGRIPAVGDHVSVDGWRLTVAEMDNRRVAAVTVAPPAQNPVESREPVEPAEPVAAWAAESRPAAATSGGSG
ncbi:MAG TPA: hemolysin family protein [Micromonosporaceae bacterium]